MKMTKFHIAALFVITLVTTIFYSCTDDLTTPDQAIGKGDAKVKATFTFTPLVSALDRMTRATAGDALKNIETLTVVVYNSKKELYRIYKTGDLHPDVDIDGNEEMPVDSAKYEHKRAEETTAKATFDFPGTIPYGTYYIYALANVDETLITESTVSTPEDLKCITTNWDPENITANGQMFGYFTNADAQQSYGYDAPPTIVNSAITEIHAWARRSASKVTLLYDGSGLHQGVTVYIHKVTIKDIPRYCALGRWNAPHNSDSLFTTGECIYYAQNNTYNGVVDTDLYPSVEQYANWMQIKKGNGVKGAVTTVNGNVIKHPETAQALYFYENMQGNYPDNPVFDKRQFLDSVGTNINKPGQPGYKDNVQYGTYIEVEGYYESSNPINISSGKIKYRFMLGKNETFDYNSERNYHYKLTLNFKGWANQPDWHIDYSEENPEVQTPGRFYVSYLYNHKCMFPVRLIGEAKSFDVEIIENNWAPFDSTYVDSIPPALVGNANDYKAFKWNKWVYYCNKAGSKEDTDKNGGYYNGKRSPWLGFLALTVPTDDPNTPLPTVIFGDANKHFYNKAEVQTYLKNYYQGNGTDGTSTNKIPQDKRTFLTDGEWSTAHQIDNGNNSYVLTKAADGSQTIKFPLWTRPKTMIYISGFTGNNPYDTYQRMAKLKVRAVFKRTGKSDTTITKIVPVYQVRRVVNPKAVWRPWDAKDEFHVKLLRRDNPRPETQYAAFESDGEWRASIKKTEGLTDFIELKAGENSRKEGDYIYGDDGSIIDFYIKFKGVASADHVACALVQVEYHGFTCEHTIFVRQGYNRALQIEPGGAHWSSFSLYSAGDGKPYTSGPQAGKYQAIPTVNPLALGTLFKRGNLAQGILVENNKDYGPLESIDGVSLSLSNRETSDNTWGSIKGETDATYTGWKDIEFVGKVNGKERLYRLPTFDDFNALLKYDFGFGVLYAKGATEVATDPDTAYGYLDSNNETLESEKGMRGVVVYNAETANQIFFPVGAFGMGRRTCWTLPNSKYAGYLRYGGVYWTLDVSKDNKYAKEANGGKDAIRGDDYNRLRPIPYNMPASPGAIYWLNMTTGGSPAWDMNYFDMNFNQYDNAVTLGENGDALPIKLIYVSDL